MGIRNIKLILEYPIITPKYNLYDSRRLTIFSVNFGEIPENSKSREPIRRYYCHRCMGDLQANPAGSFPDR